MSTTCHDFQLTITSAPDGEGYRIVLARFQDGDELASTIVSVASTAHLDAEYAELFGAYPEKPTPGERLEAFGKRLAAMLLPAEVRRALFAQLRNGDLIAPVRLRLAVKARRLDRLPWEYVYLDAEPDVVVRSDYLCLQTRFHLVRQMDAPSAIDAVSVDPLRVLVAWADPASARYPRLPHRQEEVDAIFAALRASECRRIKCDVLRGATRNGLLRDLKELSPHVLHFLGHGDIVPTGGLLILESGQPGAEDCLYGEDLAERLSDAGVRLVVLSACRTASPVRGIAQALSARRIPAVVGMQLPMRPDTSQQFVRAFYGKLAQPGSVEEAVSQARQILRDAGPDWGVPTLYLAGHTSDLFGKPTPDATKQRPPVIKLPYLNDPHFVGREKDLVVLHERLQSPVRRRFAIVGLGGLGKTQLASEYAHKYQQEYPGGVFWINAQDTLSIRDDYAALSRLFGVPETIAIEDRVQALSTEERAQRMRGLLQEIEQPALLILDNMTEDTDLALLPVVGQCRILATTRGEYLVRHAFYILPLSVLTEGASLKLLQTGRPAAGEDEENAARDIATLLGRLPLALALVANHIRRLDCSFADYLERLKASPEEMLDRARRRFLTTTKHSGAIFDAISLPYHNLSQIARDLLSAAACFASKGIPQDLLFAACDRAASRSGNATDVTRDDYVEALAELMDFCLVTRQEDGRLSIHELVQVFARGQMDDTRRGDVLEGVASVLTARLAAANEAMDWRDIQSELVHCHFAADLCRTYTAHRCLYRLLRELGVYCSEQFEVRAALAYLEEGLHLVRDVLGYGRQHPETAQFLRLIGIEKRAAEDVAGALKAVKEAFDIALELYGPDGIEIAPYYNELGRILGLSGDFDGAESCYLQALRITEHSLGRWQPSVAHYLNNLGTLYEAQGKLENAQRYIEEAIAVGRRMHGERHIDVAVQLNNLGRILGKQSKWKEALQCHATALDIYSSIHGSRPNRDIAWSHYFLAEAYHGLQEKKDAIREYEASMPIFACVYGEDYYKRKEVDTKLRVLAETEIECTREHQ